MKSEASVQGDTAQVTDDKLLGGRLKILQPRAGYRASIDAVMLAAAVPANPGERVFEAGIGFGAAALCLVTRVPEVTVAGIEIDEALVRLAVENAARNGLRDRIRIEQGDVAAPGRAMRQANLDPASFDHAYANPPYHDEEHVRAPGDPGRARAHVHDRAEMDAWARILVSAVKPGGTVSLILPAAAIGEVFALFARRLGRLALFPLYPRAGAVASRIIVQGVKGSRAAPKLLPGLVLHAGDDSFSEEAEAVLRHGAGLPLLGGSD